MRALGNFCAAALLAGGLALAAAPAGADSGIPLQPAPAATAVDSGTGSADLGSSSGSIASGSALAQFGGDAVICALSSISGGSVCPS